jgi:hypothetical protein
MVKKSQDSAIIVGMMGIIIREIAILALSISIFPLAFLFLLLRGDISGYGFKLIYQELINSGTSSVESALLLLSRVLAPYLVVQAFRAYQWSKTGKFAKRWASLYFAFLGCVAALWFAGESFDLFYFMFQLGDIPGELGQFFQLEYAHLLGALVGFYIFGRYFKLFLAPKKAHKQED